MVKLGSTLESSRKDGRLANSDNIYDKISGKMQEEINQEVSALSPVDEEDLTRSLDDDGRSVTKFADRSYSPQNFSGKGYKILRKNIKPVSLALTEIVVSSVPTSDGYLSFIINGVESHVDVVASTDTTTDKVAEKIATKLNDTMSEYDVSRSASTINLTRKFGGMVSTASSFSAVGTGVSCSIQDNTKKELRNLLTAVMLSEPNTIYEIRYDFDLEGETIEMKEGCTLKFEGGKLYNGIVVGQNTIIESKPTMIFHTNIILNGTWNIDVAHIEWFGAVGDGIVDDSIYFQNALNSNLPIICSKGKTYFFGNNIHIKHRSVNINFNKSILKFGANILISAEEKFLGTYTYLNNREYLEGANFNCENGIFRIENDEIYSVSKSLRLGFSTVVKKNYVDTVFDYNIENGNSYYYPRTAVNISGIADIIQDKGYQNTCFRIEGCFVNISDSFAKEYGGITLFTFLYSKVTVRDCNFSSTIRPIRQDDSPYYYALSFNCCSDWLVERCNMLSDWHCITTGGNNGESINGHINKCILKNYVNKMPSFCDHGNAYGLKITDSEIYRAYVNDACIYNSTIHDKFLIFPRAKELYKRATTIENSYLNISSNFDVYYLDRDDNFTSNLYAGKLVVRNSIINCGQQGCILGGFNANDSAFIYRVFTEKLVLDACTYKSKKGLLLNTISSVNRFFDKIYLLNMDIQCKLTSGDMNGLDITIYNCRVYHGKEVASGSVLINAGNGKITVKDSVIDSNERCIASNDTNLLVVNSMLEAQYNHLYKLINCYHLNGLPIVASGSYSELPRNLYVGLTYFCTEQIFVESGENGEKEKMSNLVLVYDGNSWRDVLGRKVSSIT